MTGIDWPMETIREIVLQRFRYQLQQSLPLRDLESLRDAGRMHVMIDSIARALVVRLECELLGKHGKRIYRHARWPAGWWQAFRERWFPAWWLRRHPVVYAELKVDEPTYRICPHLKGPPGGLGVHFRWLESDN